MINAYFRILLLVLVAFLAGSGCASYVESYPPTPWGTVEVKEIPAGRIIKAEAKGDYFLTKGYESMFTALSEFKRKRKLAVTLPVEAEITPKRSAMWVYIAPADKDRVLVETDKVKVMNAEKKTVVSIGARGAYTVENLSKTIVELNRWFDENPDYIRKNKPYVVFWDSLFTPWILKKYEIHVDVEKAPPEEER